jgi:hypothetical protein
MKIPIAPAMTTSISAQGRRLFNLANTLEVYLQVSGKPDMLFRFNGIQANSENTTSYFRPKIYP